MILISFLILDKTFPDNGTTKETDTCDALSVNPPQIRQASLGRSGLA